MGSKTGRPKKFQRDIERHRRLYESRDLRRVRNNWVLYWRFLAHLEDIGYRPRTVQRYHGKLRIFLIWLEPKSLRRVRKTDVEAFLVYFKSERQPVAYSVRHVREVLAVFFSWLMGFARMKVNPAKGLRMRMYYNQPEKMDLFSREETVAIIRAPLVGLTWVRKSNFPTERGWREHVYRLKMHHLILKLLFSTGVRPCELAGLEVEDFDRAKLTLRVRNKGNLQHIASDRHVFLSERTAERLQELRRMSEAVRNEDSRGKLFIHHRGGGPLGPNYTNVVVKRWAGECGTRRRVYAYMARYTYCTRLVENGVDLYSLKRLMGHTQTAVTLKHYLKLSPAEIRREWKEFNPLAPLAEGAGS